MSIAGNEQKCVFDLIKAAEQKLGGAQARKVRGVLEFLLSTSASGVYELIDVRSFEANEGMVRAVQNAIDGMRGAGVKALSYATIFNQVQERNSRRGSYDSSVRSALMDVRQIGRRWVFFVPDFARGGESAMRNEICVCMQAEFGNSEVRDPYGRPAYYWGDALKIVAHWLDLLFAAAEGKSLAIEGKNCGLVVDLLAKAVPLGWTSDSENRLALLCS